MTTPLPSLTDYNHALENPELAFPNDPVLAKSVPDRNTLGDPESATGGFAIMFQLVSGNTRYAVRCFHRQVGGGTDHTLAQRYEAISRFIRRNQSHGFLVDVAFSSKGILVGGHQFPIVRMPFVDGLPLGYWVDDNSDDAKALNLVREQINDAVKALATLGAAHGDLQHGNIMVGRDGSIRLIDYDGLYLPELAPLGALDAGHINYQHPGRSGAYDAGLDLFAASVIDLSLDAIARDSTLWEDFGDPGDKLLFDASDFADPAKSKVLERLEAMPSVADKARRLKAACLTDYDHIARALAGVSVSPRKGPALTAAAHVFLAATEVVELRQREGQQVTVHGTVESTKYLADKRVALINFGDYKAAAFAIVAFGATAKSLQEQYGYDLNRLVGQSITMTGYVRLYKSKYTPLLTPQFQLQRVGQLRMPNLAPSPTSFSASTTTRGMPRTSGAGPGSTHMSTATASGARSYTTAFPKTPRSTGAFSKSTSSSSTSFGTGASSHTSSGSSRTTDWQWAYTPPPPPPRPTPPIFTTSMFDSPPRSVHRPSYRVPYTSPYGAQFRPSTAPRPRRKSSTTWAIIAIVIALVFFLLTRCAALLEHPSHRHTSTAAPSPSIGLQSPSRNLACRIIPDGPDAGVRCDARTITFTPPPAFGCTAMNYGHAVGFAADEGPAVFMCVDDSLVNESLPVAEYGTTTRGGPFSCTSGEDGITCRDDRTGHGLHIERDDYQLF
ncbi:DUF6636 domain-containing protein [Nocardia elegans]|uniref:DUF6636 domain-containing protein n=1 Tax=Nocardia elegans TaxID=300029 RepID=A0ABW6THJ0_9NOCA